MNKIFNFSPGPSMLPRSVIESVQEELLSWRGTGMSVMEISHRSKEFLYIIEQSHQLLKELLNIPDDYCVLFMHGGASLQFASVPLNLSHSDASADYIVTGHWGEKAELEARKFSQTHIVAHTMKDLRVPKQEELRLLRDASYVHYTPNETIVGVEFNYVPLTKDVPLVADMSSNLLSRPIDVSQFGALYACTQKNIGIAGMCLVIVRKDLLGRQQPNTPSLINWHHVAENDSMPNTPSTFTWYVLTKVLQWVKSIGGVQPIALLNQKKSSLLYEYIDSSDFYFNSVEPESRSRMNVPFTLKNDSLNELFIQQATSAGLTYLKGHAKVGGMRASLYNAMPEEGVLAMIDFMHDFQTKHS